MRLLTEQGKALDVDDKFFFGNDIEFAIEGSPCTTTYGCCGSCFDRVFSLSRDSVELLVDHLTKALEATS